MSDLVNLFAERLIRMAGASVFPTDYKNKIIVLGEQEQNDRFLLL